MDLEMGRDYPTLSRWTQCNDKGSYKREVRGSGTKREGDVRVVAREKRQWDAQA